MKKYIVISALLLVVVFTKAQESQFNYINPSFLKGQFAIGERFAYLSFSEFAPGNKSYYVMAYADSDMNISERKTFAISSDAQYYGNAQNATSTILIFNDISNERMFLVSLDRDLNINVKEYSESVKDVWRHGSISHQVLSESGVLYFNRTYSKYKSEKQRKVIESGLEVMGFGPNLEKRFDYKLKNPEDVQHQIENIHPLKNEGCIVFATENSRKEKDFKANLYFVGADGSFKSAYSLNKGAGVYYPNSFKATDDGILLCGMYFDKPWYEAKNSEGMFMSKLDPLGKEIFNTTKPWSTIDEQVNKGSESDFMFSGKMKLLVHEVIESETNYSVVCETFQKSSGITGAELLLGGNEGDSRAFSLFDFVIMDFEKNGNFNSAKKIEKKNRNIEVRGGVAYKRSIELSFLLKENGVFSYRNCDGDVITYYNVVEGDPFLIKADFQTGDIINKSAIDIEIEEDPEYSEEGQEYIDNSKVLSGLQKFSDKMDEASEKLSDGAEKLDRSISKTDEVFYLNQTPSLGFNCLSTDFAVSYKLDPARMQMLLKKL